MVVIYHALFDLHYESRLAMTATVKRLARETDILVREVERHLDAYLFLDEYPWWESGRTPPPIHPAKDVCPSGECWVKGIQPHKAERPITIYA